MTKKSPRKGSALKIISIVLCFAVFIGATYAWFSDEAKTGEVNITAGNLDVDIVEAKEPATSLADQPIFEKPKGVENLDDMLWEPGVMLVSKEFKVKNNGSLALQYKLDIKSENVAGKKDLLDVVKYKVVKAEDATSITTDDATLKQRQDFWNSIGDTVDEQSTGILKKKGSGEDTSEALIVVLFWKPADSTLVYANPTTPTPDEIKANPDNQYNIKDGTELKAKFTLSVFATQTPEETDSFGDQYDANIDLTGKAEASVDMNNQEVKEKVNSFVSDLKTDSSTTSLKTGSRSDFTEITDEIWAAATPLNAAGGVRLVKHNGSAYILSSNENEPTLSGKVKGLFENCTNLTSVDLSGIDLSKVTNAQDLFAGCTSLTNVNLENVNLSGCTDGIGWMFNGCKKLKEVKLDGLDLTGVQNASSLFFNCSELQTVDLSGVKADSLTSIMSLFSGCTNLKTITFGNNFNTSNVKFMSRMFYKCSSLTSVDTDNLNTDSVIDMSDMFSDCSSLEAIDVSNFNTSNVTNMAFMFANCSSIKILDLSSFDTKNVGAGEKADGNNGFTSMFSRCTSLTTIYASEKFVVEQWEESEDEYQTRTAFYENYNLVGGAGTRYSTYRNNFVSCAHIDSVENPGYFTKKA